MCKNITSSLAFYFIGYSSAIENTKLNNEGLGYYKEWFLASAQKFSLSDSLYENVILKDPWVNTFIFNNLFGEDREFNSLNAKYAYFYIDKYVGKILLRNLNNIESKYKNEDSFVRLEKLLDMVSQQQIVLIAEYDKMNGWFDFDEAVKARKDNLDRINKELKKAGLE